MAKKPTKPKTTAKTRKEPVLPAVRNSMPPAEAEKELGARIAGAHEIIALAPITKGELDAMSERIIRWETDTKNALFEIGDDEMVAKYEEFDWAIVGPMHFAAESIADQAEKKRKRLRDRIDSLVGFKNALK
jgi:hypothetical protein